jgi:hypothetical protein
MPITSFRGEKSLAEIADLMFERLTPKQREKAEAAILKANPRLSDLSTLPRGAVLKVPDLPELRAKARRPRSPARSARRSPATANSWPNAPSRAWPTTRNTAP